MSGQRENQVLGREEEIKRVSKEACARGPGYGKAKEGVRRRGKKGSGQGEDLMIGRGR